MKTIRIKERTKDQLRLLGKANQTYDQIVLRLIKLIRKLKKGKLKLKNITKVN
jgi:hypothetical protein